MEAIEMNLEELKGVFLRGQRLLEVTEARRRDIERSLLRLDGAIQVMEEALETAASKQAVRPTARAAAYEGTREAAAPVRKATAAIRALSPVRLAPRLALSAAM